MNDENPIARNKTIAGVGTALVGMLPLLLTLGMALTMVALRANAAATLLQVAAPPALADRFRQDVAAARSVQFPPERESESSVSGEIVLRRSDTERITYRFDNGKLLRIERREEKVTRDELPLDAGCRAVSFRRGEGTVTMRLHCKAAQDITAAVGGERK
jgi:hypothetical protein